MKWKNMEKVNLNLKQIGKRKGRQPKYKFKYIFLIFRFENDVSSNKKKQKRMLYQYEACIFFIRISLLNFMMS